MSKRRLARSWLDRSATAAPLSACTHATRLRVGLGMKLVEYSASEDSDGSYDEGLVYASDGKHHDESSEDESKPLTSLTDAKPKPVDKEGEPSSNYARVQSACKSSSNDDAPPPLVPGPPAEGADAEAAANEAFPVIDWSLTVQAAKKMKVAELQHALAGRQLDTSGLKPVLVARLVEAIEEGLTVMHARSPCVLSGPRE